MAAEEGVFETLSSDDHREVWDETEKKFWSKFTTDQQQWNNDLEIKYRGPTTDLRVELSSLTGKRNALTEQHSRLVRELALVEQELRSLGMQCDAKSNDLAMMEEARRLEKADKYEHWEWQARNMTNFFRKKRGEAPLRDTEPVNGFHQLEPPRATEKAVNGNASLALTPPKENEKLVDVVDADNNVIGPVQRIEPWNQWVEAILKLPVQRDVMIRRGRRFNQEHLATIYERSEAKGVKWLSCMIQAIGKVQSTRCVSCEKNQGAFEKCIIVGGDLLLKCGNCEWNRQGCHGASGEIVDIETAEKLVAQREEAEHEARQRADRTHQDDDARKADELRREREAAVMKRHEELQQQQQRQRQLQRGPDRWERPLEPARRDEKFDSPASIQTRFANERDTTGRDVRSRHHEPWIQPAPRAPMPTEREVLAKQALAAAESASAAHAPYWRAVRPADPAHPLPPPEHILPSIRAISGPSDRDILMSNDGSRAQLHPLPGNRPRQPLPIHAPSGEHKSYPVSGGFTPANQRSRPPSNERMTPTPRSAEHSPQPLGESEPDVPVVEITRENLILRNNGTIYTYPDCVAGVPLEKIYPGHPYWDPDWKDVRAEILDARERWQQKHYAAMEAEARQEKTGSSKYQIGRQVNRGTKILEFLDDQTQISPYQLLAKKYMHSHKGGVTSYDTLFRLCETLSELSKFNLDISPVDWMRQRLHELMVDSDANGQEGFNLPKCVHDFYHDPKLTALRHKHGFKNIGRPSGQSRPSGRTSLGSTTGGSPTRPKKRKSALSLNGTPREQSYIESPLGSSMIIHDEGPFLAARSQLSKRPKSEHDQSPVSEDSGEQTDRDSVYGDALRGEDFRILQVQARGHTTLPALRQYWSWKPEQHVLEHRVLSAQGPERWRTTPEFSLRLDQVESMSFDLATNRIYIYIPHERESSSQGPGPRPRGDLMVEFKRNRTMRRFLGFCQHHRRYIRELPSQALSNWDHFQEARSGGRSSQSQTPSLAPASIKSGPLPHPSSSSIHQSRLSAGLSASPERSPAMEARSV